MALPVQCQSMSSEVNGVLVQVVVSKHSIHGGGLGVKAWDGLPAGWIIIFVVLCEHQEVFEPSLLKHPHQICG